jgi:putative Mg2+ transporter-C (MgtC) family protein
MASIWRGYPSRPWTSLVVFTDPMRFSDEAVLRLVVAVVLGGVIGAEREVNDQPAGLRTHIAVCLGAAVFGVVSTLGFEEFEARRATTNVQIDVTRVASQVVVGIGFLGAGVIFRERTVVRNLTTAASLWVTSAIGLTAGVGDIGTAAAATVILALVLVALLPVRTALRDRAQHPTRELTLHLADGVSVDDVIRSLDDLPAEVDRIRLGKADGRPTVGVRLRSEPGVDIEEAVAALVARSEITDVVPSAEVHD